MGASVQAKWASKSAVRSPRAVGWQRPVEGQCTCLLNRDLKLILGQVLQGIALHHQEQGGPSSIVFLLYLSSRWTWKPLNIGTWFE